MANGQANVSPTNEVIISIKVESGQKGERGLIGPTPQLTVSQTITGAPNTNADVTISGTPENPALTFTIPQGRPFIVEVEYPTINDLENNTNSTPIGYTPTLFDLAIIVSNQGVEDPDNAKLYIFDNGPIGGWSFVSDLSGAQGEKGDKGEPGIDGIGSEFYGQVGTITPATITIGSTSTYQSTGVTATLNPDTTGVGLGTLDNFAIKNTSNINRRAQITATYDATVTAGGVAVILGLILALNGTIIPETECRATTSALGAIAKLHTAWIIDLEPDDEVALYVANHTNGSDIDFQRGRIVVNGVSGYGPEGPQGPIGLTPQLTVAQTNTGDPGTNAEVSIAGTAENPSLTFTIPRGDKGDPGDASIPGTSLFKIRDDVDDIGDGLQIAVADEIQFTGDKGITVDRTNKIFTVSISKLDAGDF